eukprot:14669071-Ditylum_brightwellii.AAC.1
MTQSLPSPDSIFGVVYKATTGSLAAALHSSFSITLYSSVAAPIPGSNMSENRCGKQAQWWLRILPPLLCNGEKFLPPPCFCQGWVHRP